MQGPEEVKEPAMKILGVVCPREGRTAYVKALHGAVPRCGKLME